MSEFLRRIADFSPKRLLLLAAELEERVRMLEARNHALIAIVGMGCRFPGGVTDPESFWQLLIEGRDAITEVPRARWDVERLYDSDPDARGKVASKWGGFLDAPEMFDPGFFGIAPKEAVSMDPQQRILMEVAWEALEDAGIVPASLHGSRTGVYIGICNSDYAQIGMNQPVAEMDAYAAVGSSHAVAAGRISYFLGLRGPSLAIDTACSASLVAVHEACQSLRMGESELALAGGVNLVLTPEVTIGLSRAHMMAPDGRCKAFADGADGFVRSEGCGVVVLKRLSDAERDGDRVLAVIRGTAVNQDGRSSGLTAPNGPSQEDVIREALRDAGLPAPSVSYVEAHGTGTSLGDSIEMHALGVTLGQGREARLPVGSVKSNIGHAESAAGVAGLIKVVLAMGRGVIPASLHCEKPNPLIDWEAGRTRVPVRSEPWRSSVHGGPRVAALSSFGFSGTNAHVIVSESPVVARKTNADMRLRAVVLSAHSDSGIRRMAARLAKRLGGDPDLQLGDVAFTLAMGRSAFARRAAFCVRTTAELVIELDRFAHGVAGAGRIADESDSLEILSAKEFLDGGSPDWSSAFEDEAVRKVSLPTYPFEREKYWFGENEGEIASDDRSPEPILTHRPLQRVGSNEARWNAEPGETRVEALQRLVQKEAAAVLGMRRGDVPPIEAQLADLGMDSLMAVDLRNRLQSLTGIEIATTMALEYPTAGEIAVALDMLFWSAGVADDASTHTERDEIRI